jgi:ubiquinone/menaquinone biosynthesis C-methylase UbiE
MEAKLQRRIQRYGWDKASSFYENSWQSQLKPAHDLLMDLANIKAGDKVLDIAAGTGLITFRAAELAGEKGRVVASDISDEMVKIGNKNAADLGFGNVLFERMDAEELKVDKASFDVALCALGMMYFPDPDKSAAEMYHSLRPGGLAVTAVWGSRKNCGWAEIFPIVDVRVNTDVCPLFFNLGEQDMIKYPLERAGFKDVVVKKISTILHYKSAEHACEAIFLGGPVALAYDRFDDATRKEAMAEYVESIKDFKTGDGYDIPGEFSVASGVK